MEVDNETNPTQIKSLLNIVDLNKKRKFEAEQLGLPVSKHQCWNQILPSKPPTFGNTNPELDVLSPYTSKRKGVNVYHVSETGSDKDSNSFPGNSNSTMSLPADAKFETIYAKYLLYDSSSSSSNWGFTSQGSRCSLDGTTVTSKGVEKEVLSSPADVELAETLEESHVDYGNHIDYIYLGYEKYAVEQYKGEEIDESSTKMKQIRMIMFFRPDDGLSTKRIDKLRGNRPLIKSSSSTFPCLCCRGSTSI